ncbi:MAG: DUF4351 domain-containing protein [Chromatiaceae bacterium]
MSHDQNFKNLILDYPREALAFLAESEARGISADVRITPIRQEQLKERLGERFRELDVPLLVEWPNGKRAALLFVIEEESDPKRFSIHRLVHYCVDLAELCKTDRVVPVVVFLRGGPAERLLELGGDRDTYLRFHFLSVELTTLPYRRYRDSNNLVARLNLPNMRYGPEERVDVYAAAVRGLSTLEPDPERQLKYADFIDIYSALDDNERQRYETEYPQEAQIMSTFLQRVREESEQRGEQLGEQLGVQKGEARVLLRQIRLKFGEIPEEVRGRVEQADADTLLTWSERVLTANSIDDLFR